MRVLLTGATGFVGRHLYPALLSTGADVVCGTRDPERARSDYGDRTWAQVDVHDRAALERALEGCDAAFYLVHGMAQGDDYPEREAAGAENFAAAATAAGVRRVVYLGGVLPATQAPSKHLESRRRTGELLRASGPSTIELRAAMIVGAGSASWMMVRDLAARLPAMVLPRWLRNHSYPIAIDDVVRGLLTALRWPGDESHVFEIPGPERISHRDVLRRVAALLGHKRPMINVPILTPRLSSYWIALVTRVDLELAKELVEGVRYDLDPSADVLWRHTDHSPMVLERAAELALQDEAQSGGPAASSAARADAIGRQLIPPAR